MELEEYHASLPASLSDLACDEKQNTKRLNWTSLAKEWYSFESLSCRKWTI